MMARPSHPKSQEEILEAVIPLFARGGYNGVSMREVARAVGLTPGALYHHFAHKEALYLAAVSHAFGAKELQLREILDGGGDPRSRLEEFIGALAHQVHADPDFCRLVQRELLEGDEARSRLLADQVFRGLFQAMAELGREVAPRLDGHLLAVSLVSLVVHHYHTAPIRPHLPGYDSRHEDPRVLARHLVDLLAGPGLGR